MSDNLDPTYFFQELRPLVAGYKNLLFSGVKDGKNNEVKLTKSGGTGGYDSSFQMF
jgi:hypothetical protein